MPPYTYPTSFEEIEAKEWASNTVKTILTDVSPVSFQPDFCEETPKKLEILINDIVFRKEREDNPLRRSFSFLEENLFFAPSEEKEQQKNARRSHSTILPSTSYATSRTTITQSVPTSPTNKLSSQPSFSSRIRDTWHMDRASNLKNTTDIFDHKKSSKEVKAINVWKTTFAQYNNRAPPCLGIEVKYHKENIVTFSVANVFIG